MVVLIQEKQLTHQLQEIDSNNNNDNNNDNNNNMVSQLNCDGVTNCGGGQKHGDLQ